MREYIVSPPESGQHVIKYCKHLLPKAQNGFLHKMLRKKNITVNGKKADGNTQLSEGDVVRIFFSEETFGLLSDGSNTENDSTEHGSEDGRSLDRKSQERISSSILYEDGNLILVNKPAGLLSQKAKPTDISANELLIAYLKEKGELTEGFKPSVCNRLDRNTSGLLVFAKTYEAARCMAELLKDRTLAKYYLAPLSGILKETVTISGYLVKDERTNTVSVTKDKPVSGADRIETEFVPVLQGKDFTIAKIHLITGKPHQIRAQASAIGHAVIGDPKYGKKQKGLKRQLLHAYSLTFPKDLEGSLSELSGKTFLAPLPKDYADFLKENDIELDLKG